jgi:hypothetical protein
VKIETLENVRRERDIIACENTHTSLKHLVYNKDLYKKFYSRSFQKWYILDAKCNKLAFHSTEFYDMYKDMWAIFINAQQEGIHCSEKEALEFGRSCVDAMEFPYAVSVFQIRKTIPSSTISAQTSDSAIQTDVLHVQDCATEMEAHQSPEINEEYGILDALEAPEAQKEFRSKASLIANSPANLLWPYTHNLSTGPTSSVSR